MIKVLALIGESGCGKSEIIKWLPVQDLNVIESYTTRKPRHEGETGHTFVDLAEFELHKECENIVAVTDFAGFHYWTIMKQFKSDKINVYIVDVAGLQNLRLNDQLEVVAVYVQTDEEERYKRMLFTRKTEEIKRRIEHDRQAFKVVPADYVVHNNGCVTDTAKDIKKILEGEQWI